ncbi:MAG: FHA domain-containing protein [Planctomycetota bacterium]
MELQLHIKSALPDSSSKETYFEITSFFSQVASDIESPKFWIGRKRDCQIRIFDSKISRHHCYIEKNPEGNLKLVDNNSHNGCFVNGIKELEIILKEGDSIIIGGLYEIALKKKEVLSDIPIRLHIKSALPDSSSEEKYFEITSFFSQAAGDIESPKFWIGRKSDCQIRIADSKISRHHCYIEKTPEGNFKLIDNNSSNGCFVNGIEISQTILLNEGDNISIGPGLYEMVLKKKEAVADIPEREMPLPHLHTEDDGYSTQKLFIRSIREMPSIAEGHSRKKQVLVASFIIIIITVLVFLIIPFKPKDNTNDYTKNTIDISFTNEPITSTEPAVSSLPQVNTSDSVTSVSKTNLTPKPPTSADLIRQTVEGFEKQQQALKAQKEKEEAARQAKLQTERQAELEKQVILIRQQEELQWLAKEKLRWNEHKTKVASIITQYQYVNAIKSLNDFLKEVKTEDTKKEINGYIEDIQGEYLLFKNMIGNLTDGTSRKKVVIANRTIWITKANETELEGTIAELNNSVYTRQWPDIPPETILGLFSSDLSKLDHFYLAVFCYNHNLAIKGEQILIFCLIKYTDTKPLIDRFLSCYKNIPIPDGGFTEYQSQIVTAEEKSYLEKGYVKHQGTWMPYEEMMTQKGFVQFENKWVTLEEKVLLEERLKNLTALQKLLAPMGIIDKYGADKEKLPWDEARVKETDNYIIKTNISQTALDDLCYLMECLYFDMKKTFRHSGDLGKKLNVYVFKNGKEYYANGGPRGSLGVYMSRGEGKQIMTFYQPVGGVTGITTTSVLLHEGTHQFVRIVCNDEVPIWINEGLATYYESSKFEGISLKTNILNRERLENIRPLIVEKKVAPLTDFINIRQSAFTVNDYAHAWSLVYFFMNYNNSQYADELETYFAKIKTEGFKNDAQHQQLFEDTFKVKLEVLEKQWGDYVLKKLK